MAVNPCDPDPCGPNSEPPRVVGTRCQCNCLPEMLGSPPNCRPECQINNDCPTDRACINRKCQDPCPGLCGVNAYCRVRNHIPICVCNQGYIGDPFTSCQLPPSKTVRSQVVSELKYFLPRHHLTSHSPAMQSLALWDQCCLHRAGSDCQL